MMRELDYSIELSGTGETKERAFNHVFGQIKPLVARTFPERVILQIEPKDVKVLSATETVYTERFFGILFPRQRTRYEIHVAITVHLRYIELAEICFEKRQDDLTPAQRVLNMR